MAIQIRRGTASAISKANPTLLAGQPCVELDTGMMKVGNGSTAYNSLPYVHGTLASLGVTASATELNYVKGVTSSIQTQLNGKAASNHTHSNYALSSHTHSNASTSAAGFLPKLSGSASQFLRGDGTWQTVSVTDVSVTNTPNNTVKAYITATTNGSTYTGTQVFDTGVYLTTTSGGLHVETVLEIGKAKLEYDTISEAITISFS